MASHRDDIRKARVFNVFLHSLIAAMLIVITGFAGIIIYFVMSGSMAIYDIIVYLLMIFIAFPLTLFQYYYQKDPLVKKVLLSMSIMFGIWSVAVLMGVIVGEKGMAELAVYSGYLVNVGYIPVIAMLTSVFKMPQSKKIDRGIGTFILFFAAMSIITFCISSAYLAIEGGMVSADTLIGTIAIGLDIVIMAISALLILSYMPTGYRYIFAIVFIGGILSFTADSLMLITSLGLADFSSLYQICYGVMMILCTVALIGLSLLNITPTTVEEVDKKLSDTRMQMEDIVMQSPDAMGLFDERGQMIMGNNPLYRMYRADPGKALSINLFDHLSNIRLNLKDHIPNIRDGQVFAMDDIPVHMSWEKDNDKLMYISAKVFPTFASDGKISGYVSIIQDTTVRKQAEEALKKSNEELERRVKDRTALLEQVNDALQREIEARKTDEKQIKESLNEKEVLLKEIHHRVKNNLQIVSSMLSLQSSTVKDPGIVAMNMDSQNRIRSMALIHEKLYQTKNLSSIDFEEYVKSLSRFILGSYNAGNIRVTIDITNVWLDIDKAIPCGLIINELFSNCLKHAFPGRDHGEVYIGMHIEGDHYQLTVRDDGAGIKAGIDIDTSPTLGLSLVGALASQLEGEVQITSRGGTEFSIWFPADSPGKKAALPDE